MKTGLQDLDEKLPINIGDIVVIGSRPAMGKSSFMRQIALTHARNGGKVFIWCGELPPITTFVHLLCLMADVSRDDIGSFRGVEKENIIDTIQSRQESGECDIDGSAFQRLRTAMDELISMDIKIHQRKRGENPYDIAESIYDMASDDLLVVVDYIQLFVLNSPNGADKPTQDFTRFMSLLREITVDTNTTFLVGSQVHRRVEERQGHRPTLLDLKDSSSMGEIANKVVFILRRDYYDPNDKPGMVELIVSKSSDGPACSAVCTFNPKVGSFCDYTPYKHIVDSVSDEAFSELFSEFNP